MFVLITNGCEATPELNFERFKVLLGKKEMYNLCVASKYQILLWSDIRHSRCSFERNEVLKKTFLVVLQEGIHIPARKVRNGQIKWEQ